MFYDFSSNKNSTKIVASNTMYFVSTMIFSIVAWKRSTVLLKIER